MCQQRWLHIIFVTVILIYILMIKVLKYLNFHISLIDKIVLFPVWVIHYLFKEAKFVLLQTHGSGVFILGYLALLL